MIRTAILAGILLVLLSMAYSRPGAMPSLTRTTAPVIEEARAPVHVEPVRAEAPKPAPVAEEEVALSEPVAAPEPPAPVVAEVAPGPPSVAPQRVEPQRAELPSPIADAGKPVQLLPESMRAPEPARAPIAPLVADNMPAPAAPQLPAEVPAAQPPAALPETHVPTRPVMVPRDYASRLTPDGVMADPTPAPAAAIPEARSPVIAAGTKFMTPEERSRELYRLAREMEDTFIRNMTQ